MYFPGRFCEVQCCTGNVVRAIHKSPLSWESLTFIPGAGSISEPQTYTHRIHNLEAGTHHFRLKQIDFDGGFGYSDIITLDGARPEALALLPNYPNPFNPTTEIRYEVPVTTHVNLVVHDLMGKEVAVLMDGVQEAGRYEVAFDGSNLASGVYFYRLKTPAQVLIKQMILLK